MPTTITLTPTALETPPPVRFPTDATRIHVLPIGTADMNAPLVGAT